MPFEPELNGVTVTKSSLGILAFVTNFSLNSGIGIGFFFFFNKKKREGRGDCFDFTIFACKVYNSGHISIRPSTFLSGSY